MLKQRIFKKITVYISRVIYWSRKSRCVKKTQKNKNKLALLQSMTNRKKSEEISYKIKDLYIWEKRG